MLVINSTLWGVFFYAPLDKLVKSSLSKGEVLPVRIRGGVPYLGSLTVKQRIYIPCATDNWPMWVRLPPEVPSSCS